MLCASRWQQDGNQIIRYAVLLYKCEVSTPDAIHAACRLRAVSAVTTEREPPRARFSFDSFDQPRYKPRILLYATNTVHDSCTS